jgi:hypothetical protein
VVSWRYYFGNINLIVSRSIADADGPKIADTFYYELFKENNSATTEFLRPGSTQAAQALHIAVTKLRSNNVSFMRWVPFIHIGR